MISLFVCKNPCPCHESKQVEYRCIAPLILNLGTGWKKVVNFIPHPLYPPYPLNKRLGGPHYCLEGLVWNRKSLAPKASQEKFTTFKETKPQ